ncbi:RNA 2',3'-cyclic phosphodiesterase [Micromonospora sp. WMMA1363]|uniref:RNA 2',3'-cyclic phosphodiesterase n=1 Tax=Micromonospora sp. WMMA1363 TaxID=3053985 RepID=UPI00259C9CBA|nr:RNA 2',3'-cyclic phosphodiesterase [Micromonospora sp. WMMA1363]MDM4722231.1 RNA 2',3'-cyclic phosphodiesterase [Micromonospora sp. WMMA1363]
MRLFAAVYPSPEAVEHLGAQITHLRVGVAGANGINVRLADPVRAHVTLVFLGEVEADRLMAVESALGLAAEWSRDGREVAPRLRLGGGGRFGRGRFTILWVDLRGEVEALTVLSRLIRSRLRSGRLPYDEKPFRPHLTIARPGDRLPSADVAADVEALHAYQGPEWPANELVLVRSHPGPRPTYDRLAGWPL